mmetsp:Transcript_13235/g.31750  ORF Transcript_13235/g.31750 Transcript_13235/m.31750 type:complete len:238 (-) Transcript_13235:3-716(-)
MRPDPKGRNRASSSSKVSFFSSSLEVAGLSTSIPVSSSFSSSAGTTSNEHMAPTSRAPPTAIAVSTIFSHRLANCLSVKEDGDSRILICDRVKWPVPKGSRTDTMGGKIATGLYSSNFPPPCFEESVVLGSSPSADFPEAAFPLALSTAAGRTVMTSPLPYGVSTLSPATIHALAGLFISTVVSCLKSLRLEKGTPPTPGTIAGSSVCTEASVISVSISSAFSVPRCFKTFKTSRMT